MTGIFEVEEGRNNNIKHVDVLQKVSRADGDRPEEGSMVAKNTKGINVILDYLTDLTLHVEATKKVFDSMVLYGGKQKLKEIKTRKTNRTKYRNNREVQNFEEINKGVEHVNASFVKKINDSKNRTSTQFFKSN